MERDWRTLNYKELYNDLPKDPGFVYIVSPDSLPSQYRSLKLFPVSSCDKDTEPDQLPKTRISMRRVYVILVSIFVVSVVLAATILLFEIRKVVGQSERKVFQEITGNYKAVETAVLHSNNSEVPDLSVNFSRQEERTPCISACRAYSAPKFRSRCESGYCVCKGENYQIETCLPIVNSCVMHKSSGGFAKAYIQNSPKPVYSCRTGTQSLIEIHVISIYGNHFAKQTVVNISGSQRSPLTFILASHYPVHWKLKFKDLEIRNVVVVSDNDVNRSTVDINSPVGNLVLPDVKRTNMFVGYGDDRHNSNTTDMLRTVKERFGVISSFSGAAFADYFGIKLNV